MAYRKRKRPDEEELAPRSRWRRPKNEEKEPVAYNFVRPDFGTGNGQDRGYATLSHSNLKTWAKVAKAQSHNRREIYTPNARDDAPEPIELLDEMSGPYVDRVKAVLTAHGVSHHVRSNGTIATEDVYGASEEYWNRDGDWKLKDKSKIINDPVVQAAIGLARKKHGRRLISCALHLDEDSPHIHVIAVPLVYREHAPRGRKPKDCKLDENGDPIDYRKKVWRWSLDVSAIRGLSSQLELAHDEWAAECKPFGLIRGVKGSELSEEQRRARRAAQTGRASKLAKAARLERERLLAEAKAGAETIRERTRQETEEIKAESQAARDAAEADQKKAAIAVEEAEALKARASERLFLIQNMESDAARLKKEAEAANAAAKKAANDNQAKSDALALQEKQLALLVKAMDEQNGLHLCLQSEETAGISAKAVSQEEKQIFESPWSPLLHNLRLIAATTMDRMRAFAAAVTAQRDELEKQKAMVSTVAKVARNFQAAWEAIPEGERSPAIKTAGKAAALLNQAAQLLEDRAGASETSDNPAGSTANRTNAEFPPGWAGPGKGGVER